MESMDQQTGEYDVLSPHCTPTYMFNLPCTVSSPMSCTQHTAGCIHTVLRYICLIPHWPLALSLPSTVPELLHMRLSCMKNPESDVRAAGCVPGRKRDTGWGSACTGVWGLDGVQGLHAHEVLEAVDVHCVLFLVLHMS